MLGAESAHGRAAKVDQQVAQLDFEENSMREDYQPETYCEAVYFLQRAYLHLLNRRVGYELLVATETIVDVQSLCVEALVCGEVPNAA